MGLRRFLVRIRPSRRRAGPRPGVACGRRSRPSERGPVHTRAARLVAARDSPGATATPPRWIGPGTGPGVPSARQTPRHRGGRRDHGASKTTPPTYARPLDALTQLPGKDWEPAARRLLGDRSESVVFRALCLLKDAGWLRRADVEPLFRSPDKVVRRNALWASGTIQDESVEIPDSLLHDPDQQVRHYAIIAWGRVNPDRAAVLFDLLQEETDLNSISCLIGTLGKIGDRAAVPVLIEMTRHADAFVRQDAARRSENWGIAGRSRPSRPSSRTRPSRTAVPRADRSRTPIQSPKSLTPPCSSCRGGERPPALGQGS